MRPIDKSLAIEFGTDRILFSLLTRRLKRTKLKGVASLEIDDKISDQELGDQISDTLEAESLSTRRVVAGLHSREFMFHRLSLPFVEEQSLSQMLEFELDKHIPYSAADVYFDHIILNPGIDEKRDILLVAIERTRLERYYEILKNAGITPFAIVPAITALSDCIQPFTPESDSDSETIFLLKGMDEGFEISRIGSALLQSQQAFKLVQTDESNDEECYTGDILCNSLKHSGLLTRRKGAAKKQKLILLDPPFGKEALDVLADFAPELEISNSDEMLTRSPLIPSNLAQSDEESAYITSIALASRSLWKQELKCNLLPEEKRGGDGHLGMIGAISLTVISVILGISIVTGQTMQQKKNLSIIEDEVSKITSEVKKVRRLEEESRLLQDKIDKFDEVTSAKFMPLFLLAQVSANTPSESWLTRLEMKGDKVKLTGFAENISDVADLKIKLDKVKMLEDIEELTQSSRRGEKYYFRISATIMDEE